MAVNIRLRNCAACDKNAKYKLRIVGKPCMSCVYYMSSVTHYYCQYSCTNTIELWRKKFIKYIKYMPHSIHILQNSISTKVLLQSLQCSPKLTSWLGRGMPLLISKSLNVFGISLLVLLICTHTKKNKSRHLWLKPVYFLSCKYDKGFKQQRRPSVSFKVSDTVGEWMKWHSCHTWLLISIPL